MVIHAEDAATTLTTVMSAGRLGTLAFITVVHEFALQILHMMVSDSIGARFAQDKICKITMLIWDLFHCFVILFKIWF